MLAAAVPEPVPLVEDLQTKELAHLPVAEVAVSVQEGALVVVDLPAASEHWVGQTEPEVSLQVPELRPLVFLQD